MTNKHTGRPARPGDNEQQAARSGLINALGKLGQRSKTKARIADELLGTTGRRAVGIYAPGELTNAEVKERKKRLPAGTVTNEHGQVVPAVELNPAVTMHTKRNRKVEVVEMSGRALPVVADPQGTAWTAEGGGADLADDDDTPYYGVNVTRAIIGTESQIRGFFSERSGAGHRIALTADGADKLGIRISPFIALPPDKQWNIIDPQTAIVAHFAKTIGGLGLGAGIGSASIPGGSVPIADLADFFNTVRETLSDVVKPSKSYEELTAGSEFLVELDPYQAFTDTDELCVCKTIIPRTGHGIKIGGTMRPSISVESLEKLVLELLGKLKLKMVQRG